jgi:hypothetical protein
MFGRHSEFLIKNLFSLYTDNLLILSNSESKKDENLSEGYFDVRGWRSLSLYLKYVSNTKCILKVTFAASKQK